MNPRNAELSAITEVINKYAEGCHTGDIALLREAFHPDAMMYGSSGEQTIVTPIEGLYSFIETNEPPAKSGEPHQCFISSIQFEGGAANVRDQRDVLPLREPAGEQAAGDALLSPVGADLELSARVQDRHFR